MIKKVKSLLERKMTNPAYRKRHEKSYKLFKQAVDRLNNKDDKIISCTAMKKRLMKTKLLDMHDVLKEELKDKKFRKYYKKEGQKLASTCKNQHHRRFFVDRLKEELKTPTFRKVFEAAESSVKNVVKTSKIKQRFPRP